MKIPPSRSKPTHAQRGSVLVLALVLAGLGTIGVAAWATLLGARHSEAEQRQAALDRRIQFSNSLALGRQVLYQKYLHANSGPAAIEEYILDGNWGRALVQPFNEAPLAFAGATRTNKTGAVPFRAFSLDVEVGIGLESSPPIYNYHLKSYSPVLGGDLVCVHKNDEDRDEKVQVTGNFKIHGRASFWKADYQIANQTARTDHALTAGDTLPDLSLLNTDDDEILPSNFPFITQTAGSFGGTANLDGKLDIINNTDFPSNGYFQKVQSYGTDNYHAIDAEQSGGYGDGADTNPMTTDEDAVTGIINGGGYTATELAPHAPISSPNLTLILQDTTLPKAELQQILADNQPLPDDVYDDVIDNPTLNFVEKRTVLDNSGFTVFAQGDGEVVVDLNNPNLPHLLIQNCTDIVLHGQPDPAAADAVADLDPIIIAIDNEPTVEMTHLVLVDINKRRIVVAAHHEGVASNHAIALESVSATAFPEWHAFFDFEGTRAQWSMAAGGLRLFGGIRSDQGMFSDGGDIIIRPQENADVLETMLSRAAWIEVSPK